MKPLGIFRFVLFCMAVGFIPLAFVGQVWLPLIGVTAMLYLVYMFFFNWDETYQPHHWVRK